MRSEIIRNALVQQLKETESLLRGAKNNLEMALAQDDDLTNQIAELDKANLSFKDQIKHANMHVKPKPKPKAKAALALADGSV